MTKRAAAGAGNIRKKTVTRNGKQYLYWEARLTTGRDPGTGRQIQQSFTGKTQREVREKLQAAAVAVNTGAYRPPSRLTLGQWLEIWIAEYLGSVKPGTVSAYTLNIRNHICPALGAIPLRELHPHMVQHFVNDLEGLSAGSVRLIYKILHMALEKAVQLGYLIQNPSNGCVLPRAEQQEIRPLDDGEAAALLAAARGTGLETLVYTALFTGLRLSELLGLTWGCVDWITGTLLVNKQLALPAFRENGLFLSPKSGKSRTIVPAGSVLAALKRQQARQSEQRLLAGAGWRDSDGLVFTLPDGRPIDQWRVRRQFQTLLTAAGLEGVRFHDLRHPYVKHTTKIFECVKKSL